MPVIPLNEMKMQNPNIVDANTSKTSHLRYCTVCCIRLADIVAGYVIGSLALANTNSVRAAFLANVTFYYFMYEIVARFSDAENYCINQYDVWIVVACEIAGLVGVILELVHHPIDSMHQCLPLSGKNIPKRAIFVLLTANRVHLFAQCLYTLNVSEMFSFAVINWLFMLVTNHSLEKGLLGKKIARAKKEEQEKAEQVLLNTRYTAVQAFHRYTVYQKFDPKFLENLWTRICEEPSLIGMHFLDLSSYTKILIGKYVLLRAVHLLTQEQIDRKEKNKTTELELLLDEMRLPPIQRKPVLSPSAAQQTQWQKGLGRVVEGIAKNSAFALQEFLPILDKLPDKFVVWGDIPICTFEYENLSGNFRYGAESHDKADEDFRYLTQEKVKGLIRLFKLLFRKKVMEDNKPSFYSHIFTSFWRSQFPPKIRPGKCTRPKPIILHDNVKNFIWEVSEQFVDEGHKIWPKLFEYYWCEEYKDLQGSLDYLWREFKENRSNACSTFTQKDGT